MPVAFFSILPYFTKTSFDWVPDPVTSLILFYISPDWLPPGVLFDDPTCSVGTFPLERPAFRLGR